jgi:hypothetical protein
VQNSVEVQVAVSGLGFLDVADAEDEGVWLGGLGEELLDDFEALRDVSCCRFSSDI